MSDLLRSAFSYFSQPPQGSVHILGKTDHPLVGTSVEVGPYRLKIRSLIAEGGYALVFSAQDYYGNWYALKRQLAADRDAANAIVREIEFLRFLSGHPSIIRFVQSAHIASRDNIHGRDEYLLLTELCSGGNVVELLQRGPLSVSQVAKIFFAACWAVYHMHSKNPPITHRDMKVENLLFDSTGRVKLCDFGSATTEIIKPDETWNASRRTRLEEDLARFTTPMYRAPEVLDVYSNYVVGPPQDIWALGCVLFYLCYRRHPFEDSAKLRILNAKYSLPDTDTGYSIFNPLIKGCLQIDPAHRSSIKDLCEQTKALGISLHIDLESPVDGVDIPVLSSNVTTDSFAGAGDRIEQQRQSSSRDPPPRPPPSAFHKIGFGRQEPSAQQQASAMLGALKGQGMSWFKNIKDKTAAVAQTVQSTYGGRGPDVLFLTTKLVIAPISEAIPDALAAQVEETMRTYILEHSRGRFAIYNLSPRRLRGDYNNCLSEIPMPPISSAVAPTLKTVLSICRNMVLFLQQCATNFVVITGPEIHCCLMAAAMLLYGRLFTKPYMALQLIESKRNPIILPSSSHHVLDLLSTIVNSTPQQIRSMVHNRQTSLNTLLISPPPKFNIAKTGCRPVIDVFANGSKLWSSRKPYDMLRAYDYPSCSTAEIDLENVVVAGEVQIIVHHARWSKVHGKMQELFMFSLCFYSNFIDPNTHILELSSENLDIHADDEQKFDRHFRVGVRLHISDSDRGFNNAELPGFLRYDANSISKLVLVSSKEEYQATAGDYEQDSSVVDVRPIREEPAAKKNEQSCLIPSVQELKIPNTKSGADFFSTLPWNEYNMLSAPSDQNHSRSTSPVVQLSSEQMPKLTINKKRDIAEEYERLYGIRVGGDESEDPDAELYKFDYEKESNKESSHLKTTNSSLGNVDLLGLDSDSSPSKFNGAVHSNSFNKNFINLESSLHVLAPLDDLLPKSANIPVETKDCGTDDDLLEWSSPKLTEQTSNIHRNVSAPAFASPVHTKPVFDPFADFLATHPDPVPTSSNTKPGGSGSNSGRVTPNIQKPNYSRSHFGALNSIGGAKPKVNDNTFDDLLSSHGFTTSKSQKSISEMRKEEENKEMDPVSIKIRDWITGKEGNIRALLGSLNEVLWPGADKWVQPSMGELLSASQVKKYYRKACLVIHPDKQVGTENEDLARAIFTELNEAWSAFEAAGSPAL